MMIQVACDDDDSSTAWLKDYSCAQLASFGWCTNNSRADAYIDKYDITNMKKRCPTSCNFTCGNFTAYKPPLPSRRAHVTTSTRPAVAVAIATFGTLVSGSQQPLLALEHDVLF